MKDETTFTYIGGSWYIRIPPSFVRHIGLNEEDKTDRSIPGNIQDETGKHGPYCSIWKTKNGQN
jgi:hypothetical protein